MASSTALSVAFMRASSRWQRRRVFQTDSRDLGALVVSLVAILCQLAWPEYNPLRRSRQPPLAPGASTIPTVLPTVPIARAGSRTTGPPILGGAGDLPRLRAGFYSGITRVPSRVQGPGPKGGRTRWRHQGWCRTGGRSRAPNRGWERAGGCTRGSPAAAVRSVPAP